MRISVFRSNRYIYAQVIDDEKGETIVSVHEKELSISKNQKLTKQEKAKNLGLLLAKKVKKLKIEKLFFDRGRYKYHGRVKALCEGAREGGLRF